MSDDSPMEALVGLVAVATLPLAALAALFVGGRAAAVVAIVGWLFLVPVLGIISDYFDLESSEPEQSGVTIDAGSDASDGEDEALQRLRERYAAGEIDEAEFERRVERLIETEELDPNAAGASGVTDSPTGLDEPVVDSKREPERERE